MNEMISNDLLKVTKIFYKSLEIAVKSDSLMI